MSTYSSEYEEKPKSKIGIVIVVVIAIAIGAYVYQNADPLANTNTLEEDSFSIELPKAFSEDEDNRYYNDTREMYFEWEYYDNDFTLNGEDMLDIAVYSEFLKDDIIKKDMVNIDGEDVWQAQYRSLQTGDDNIHYYYSGVIAVFELEDEFLVVDLYKWMTEADGISSEITESDLQLINDIIDTVVITDASYDNKDSSPTSFYVDTLTLNLTSSWSDITDIENSYDEYGTYGYFRYEYLPIWIDNAVYVDENATDVDEFNESLAEYVLDGTYTSLGEETIAGERGYIYSYDGFLSDDRESYVSGIFCFTEHYYIEIYINSYNEDYEMSQATVDALVEYMLQSQ